MLSSPQVAADDPAVTRGLTYILSRQQATGGIHDNLLENYNTSIALMALARAKARSTTDQDTARFDAAIKKAQDYLRDLQWADGKVDPAGQKIETGHPFYGGAGYGKHGRPDLSNTAVMIAGLHDSGLSCEDPAYQRAMQFITMLQGTEANKTFGSQIEPGGGFIYSTSVSKDQIGQPQTQVDPATVISPDGRSLLRTYGSMTYAGFMSYLYTQLDRNDPRVADAMRWIRGRFTVDENPGAGMQGYYYYLHLMARALDAWGEPVIETTDGSKRVWANELIAKLAALQKPDGSFINDKDRWMEGDANLVTAYVVLAIQHAMQ
jgi:squalene-hopene/tetraprenyl-beta-curcumene cyclase